MLLNNIQVKEEIKEIKRYIETNRKKNMAYQKFRDTAKAVLKGKFISL